MSPTVMTGVSVDNHRVRIVERASIRAFVESCVDHLDGRVLDYGCGKEPYRDIVARAGGDYIGYDRVAFPANVSGQDVGPDLNGTKFDAVLCNQVAQYWPNPGRALSVLWDLLAPDGVLVMTYPTTWAEVEPQDLWRFTKRGMEALLDDAGFTVLAHEQRAVIDLNGFRLPLGYGVLAHA